MMEWFLACVLLGCCLVPAAPVAVASEPDAPDLSKVVAVVGQSSVAHACPIGPELLLTAAHVVQDKGLVGAEAKAYRAENAEWAGFVDAEMASDYEDAGFLRADTRLPSWYEFALAPPKVGERLWWVGYDWRKREQAFQRRVFSGRVVTLVAGNIVFDTETPNGSSGSCVLNAAGQVVGVISWGKSMEDTKDAAVAVGMWPPWFTGVKKRAPEPVAEAKP